MNALAVHALGRGAVIRTGVFVMTSVLKKVGLGLAAVATLAVTATPADAQRYRHYRHGDRTGAAIGAGIIGLGIGAAIASSNRGYYNRGYYNDPYYGSYDPYYGNSYAYNGYDNGYYDQGYYQGYRRHCTTRRQWDPYYGRWVRVRYC
jgi:hypothetical protein